MGKILGVPNLGQAISKCGARNAERGTALLHYVTQTRIDIKCGVRSAEQPYGVRNAECGVQ